MKKHWLLTAALLVCTPALLAWDVVISMDRPDGQYKIGETAKFTVKAVGDDVPDSFLDDLLALRWKENLKLWLTYFSCSEEKKE